MAGPASSVCLPRDAPCLALGCPSWRESRGGRVGPGRAAERPGGCLFPPPCGCRLPGPPLRAQAVPASGEPGAGSGRGPSAPEAVAAAGRDSGPGRTCRPGSAPRRRGSSAAAPGSRRPLSAGGGQPRGRAGSQPQAEQLGLSRLRGRVCQRCSWTVVACPPACALVVCGDLPPARVTKPCQSYSLAM